MPKEVRMRVRWGIGWWEMRRRRRLMGEPELLWLLSLLLLWMIELRVAGIMTASAIPLHRRHFILIKAHINCNVS